MTTVRETFGAIEIPEGGSGVITGYLEDETGLYIPVAGISTIKLWLDDSLTAATISTRANQEIKNLNGGTVVEVQEAKPPSATIVTRTKLTLVLGPADNPIVDSAVRSEWHLGTIKATYAGTASPLIKEFLVKVYNTSRP